MVILQKWIYYNSIKTKEDMKMTNGFNPGYPMNTCTGPGMSIPVSEPERVLYEVTKSNAEMVAAVNTLHNNTQKSLYDNQKLMERMARKSKNYMENLVL